MSDYRDELIEEAQAESAKILEATSQIDVTSGGNYAAAWMKQDEQFGTSKRTELDRIADANEAMAEIWRSESGYSYAGEWTGLDATQESATVEDLEGNTLDFTRTTIPFYDSDSKEIEERGGWEQNHFDDMFGRYVESGGSQDIVDKAKQTQVYQALDSTEDLSELADRVTEREAASPEVTSAPATSLDNLESAVAQNQQLPSAPPRQESPVDVDEPPLTRTQERAQSRGDAGRARQERAKPQEAEQPEKAKEPEVKQGDPPLAAHPLQKLQESAVKQEPEANAGDEPLNRTQEQAKSRGDALRARQQRAREFVEDQMPDAEANENRQPNFRAGATAMNSSVADFATVTADMFEDTAQQLAMATARIRALERAMREASR